ncbi:MAG TPA: hypothetical protein VI072_30880 [Polyangiaceae bacterium]
MILAIGVTSKLRPVAGLASLDAAIAAHLCHPASGQVDRAVASAPQRPGILREARKVCAGLVAHIVAVACFTGLPQPVAANGGSAGAAGAADGIRIAALRRYRSRE